MSDIIETVNLEDEVFTSLNDVIKRNNGSKPYPIPCVHIGKTVLSFSKKGREYAPRSFKWLVNEKWLVMQECKETEPSAWFTSKSGDGQIQCRVPSSLKDDKRIIGLHKIYKTKDGIAFKRYEIL